MAADAGGRSGGDPAGIPAAPSPGATGDCHGARQGRACLHAQTDPYCPEAVVSGGSGRERSGTPAEVQGQQETEINQSVFYFMSVHIEVI